MSERKKVLETLLRFDRPLKEIETALAAFAWDAEAELAFLSVRHIASVLNRFVNGSTTGAEIEDWANLIEAREDIGFEPRSAEVLEELVHELANPVLTQRLTRERAFELLKQVDAAR